MNKFKKNIKKRVDGIEKGAKKEVKILKIKIWEITKIILGVILVIFGIASLFLPIFPGILIIIIGLILLGNKPLKKLLCRIVNKIKQTQP